MPPRNRVLREDLALLDVEELDLLIARRLGGALGEAHSDERRAGEQRKTVALALGDAQAQQVKASDEIRTLVHAQQRETEALLEAMADKGLRAEAGGLVRRLVPERVADGWWEDHKRTVSRRAWT